MSDPFEIGKIDKLGGGSAASSLQSLGGASAASAPASAPAAEQTQSQAPAGDQVQLSDEAGGSEAASSAGGVNFGAWGGQTQEAGASEKVGEVGDSQAPGMQAGAVHGPEGTSGQEPGMQAGGVHNASEEEKS